MNTIHDFMAAIRAARIEWKRRRRIARLKRLPTPF
jgi:hypothetical protein